MKGVVLVKVVLKGKPSIESKRQLKKWLSRSTTICPDAWFDRKADSDCEVCSSNFGILCVIFADNTAHLRNQEIFSIQIILMTDLFLYISIPFKTTTKSSCTIKLLCSLGKLVCRKLSN